ncbi:MAG TPA: RNA polymerase sigma factor [Blastocatellia bacterium]|jgi:RNA polymerase sigma-70 factor, ECF subfamily|nr:RNA polymerase sigma factor [Blastocatellia bacterium]
MLRQPDLWPSHHKRDEMASITNALIMSVTAERSPAASDLELARAAAAGDATAFEKLYEQHHRRVYSLCLRMLGSVGQAEDLTQEVFLQVYRKIGSFRGDSAFTTWLHRLAVNQVLMHFRRRGVKLEHTSDEGDFTNVVETPLQSTRRISMVDRLALERAVGELPPGYRTVFVLHDVEGYEHTEISDMLHVSIGTSKSQLHKARMRLRELLTK